jgi:hypothetical protein
MDNILPFPNRPAAVDRSPSTSLEVALRQRARLSEADKRICSVNLGKFIEKVAPNGPLQAARAIFNLAKMDFAKRQRWITLPGEQPKDVLGSSGATWLSLAKAAASLVSQSSSEDDRKIHVERSLRALLRGTSFVPDYIPETFEQASLKRLADSYAENITSAILKDGLLERLWDVLARFPFAAETIHASEMKVVDEVPLDWSDLQYGDRHKWAFEVGSSVSTNWSHPRHDIGCIIIPRTASIFILPETLAEQFALSNEDDDGLVPESAIRQLAGEIGSKLSGNRGYELHEQLPNIRYSSEVGYGWIDVHGWDDARVRLKVIPNDDNQMKLVVDYFYPYGGDPRFIFSESGNLETARIYVNNGSINAPPYILSEIENSANNRYKRSDTSSIRMFDTESGGSGELVYFQPISYRNDPDIRPLGILGSTLAWTTPSHFDLDTDTVLDWCDTPEWAEMMLSNRNVFVPNFPLSSKTVPFPKGSIAHALFSNLYRDDIDARLDQLMIRHARRTAEIGLEWYSRLMEDAETALRRMVPHSDANK